MCRRRLKKSASKPISSSEDRSGFKFGFPGLLASKLLTSVPVCWSTFVTFCEPGENCWKASVGRGWTPFARTLWERGGGAACHPVRAVRSARAEGAEPAERREEGFIGGEPRRTHL